MFFILNLKINYRIRQRVPAYIKIPQAGGRFLFFLFVFSLFAGCSPRIFKGMENTGKKQISKQELYPVFSDRDSVRVFNMEISYKENSFSGLLVVKPENENSLRAIFTTYFGVTVFDFEFSDTEFKVNRCMEQMNKKVILGLMEKDFRTLFLYNVPPVTEAKIYKGEGTLKGYKIKTEDGKGYFITDTDKKELHKVEIPGSIKRLCLEYQDYENNFPRHIWLCHPKIKLSMKLDKIKP
jgi:hypothetical protein